MERTDFDNELKSNVSDKTRAFYLRSNLVSVSTTETRALSSPINFMTIYYLLHHEVRKTLWRLHNSDKTFLWSIIHTNRNKTITFSRAVRFDSFPCYNRHRIEMIKPTARYRLTYNISRTYAVRNDWSIRLIYRIKRSFGSINLLEESSKPEQKTFANTPVADAFGILFEP